MTVRYYMRKFNRALLRDTNIGILITNENGYITMINRQAEDYLEIAANSVQGRLLSDPAAQRRYFAAV